MSHSIFCVLIMVFSAFLAAFAQILLKKSSMEKHHSFIYHYFNGKVISAYCIFTLTLFMNIYAFTGIAFKYGSVINSCSYIFTMILSIFLLHDKISWRCFCGNLLIVIGVAVYVSNIF